MNAEKPHPYYRWVIVASGGLLGCVAIGAMFSLPVLLRPIARDTGWSTTGISSAMTLGFVAMALGSMFWGNLSDRIGPRYVVLGGSILLSISMMLTSLTTSLLAFQLTFGLLVGLSTSGIFAPMMACVTGWFDTKRSLAVSLVSAGMGTAPMTMSPLVAWLVVRHDWRPSMLILAALVACIMIPVSLLVRRPPALSAKASTTVPADANESGLTVSQALRSTPFITLLLTNFLCCATHSGPIFHTVSYAVTCGIPLMAAVSIYSLEGLGGLGGRIAFGLLGDRFGAKRVLVLGLLAQAIGALAYLAAGQLDAFYAIAIVFGFIYSGVMPLYSVIVRENFPIRMLGTIIGGLAMAGSLGMATGPVIGGLIFDTTGAYSWLFVFCFALGIGAFLIAMTFKPFMPAPSGLASLASREPHAHPIP